MSDQSETLLGDYSIRFLSTEEFTPLFQQFQSLVFRDKFNVNKRGMLTDEEREAIKRLGERLGTPFRINIGIYHQEQFVGWSFGIQESAEKFYMVNTGILPEHQGKGIYTALLPRMLQMIRAEGFQIVTSRHTATNNQVIVPKLKAGFVITGIEISDVFGTLVHLGYFFNPIRRKMLDVRSGELRPDGELREFLEL